MKKVRVFYCYAHEDGTLREELEKHFTSLRRLDHIVDWSDCEMLSGTNWKQEVNRQLNTADVILLLLSPNFMASDYCYGTEMQQALTRHKNEDIIVIPIILRPVHWENTPLGELQALPVGGKPITRWRRRDDAYFSIVEGINKVVKPLLAQRWRDKGHDLSVAKQYEQVLAAYDRAIRLEPDWAETFYWEGNVLFALHQYDEARIDYSQSIDLDPDNSDFYYAKAITLLYLDKYDEALHMAEKAIQLTPDFVEAYNCKGDILLHLVRTEEALDTFSKAKQIEKERDSKPVNELLDDWGY